jgi:oxepin-CoA hydrolase/3-oxo-5,6-dehydrosuberyl-CoA semialdehyde dehydrogenase
LKAVDHGYFNLSRAAATSRAKRRDVDPPKGPVLLDYCLDECRFVKPVYPGMTCHPGLACPGHRTGDPGQVRFTVKEKVDQEKRTPSPGLDPGVAKGIVKFLVDVFDETGETVAIATILTMVKKLDQN